jgi:hypothetical protein
MTHTWLPLYHYDSLWLMLSTYRIRGQQLFWTTNWFVAIVDPLQIKSLLTYCYATDFFDFFRILLIVSCYQQSPHSTLTNRCSSFDLSSSQSVLPGTSGFSLLQTEPIQGNDSGHFWHGATSGQQNLHLDSSLPNGHAQNGFFEDSFNSFREGNSRSSFSSSRSLWNGDLSSASIDGEDMKRFPSQDSIGAQSSRTANSYDQSRSMMYPNVSQMSFHVPSASSDGTGRSNSPDNSAIYTPTQLDLQALEYHYQGEDFGTHTAVSHRSSIASSANPFSGSITLGQSYAIFPAGNDTFVYPNTFTQGTVLQDSVVYNASSVSESPMWEENIEFLDSQTSSPTQEESWELPLPELAPTAHTPSDYSPIVEGLAPRYVPDFPDFVELLPHNFGDRQPRKPVGPRYSKVASDLSRRPRLNGSEASDESIKAIGRSSVDLDNTARDHPLYHNASPLADGLYHCPWEKESTCGHKPEKLKCNYE